MKRKILKLFLSFPLFLSAATAAGKSAIMPWEYFGMDGYTKNVFENYLIKIKFQKTFLELQWMEEDWNGAHKTFLDLQKLEPTDKVARNRDEGTHLY